MKIDKGYLAEFGADAVHIKYGLITHDSDPSDKYMGYTVFIRSGNIFKKL